MMSSKIWGTTFSNDLESNPSKQRTACISCALVSPPQLFLCHASYDNFPINWVIINGAWSNEQLYMVRLAKPEESHDAARWARPNRALTTSFFSAIIFQRRMIATVGLLAIKLVSQCSRTSPLVNLRRHAFPAQRALSAVVDVGPRLL